MIRINRKNTEKTRLAIADLQKARKSGKTYNTKPVNAALVETFHGKCYICENKKATAYQIEHLIPHRDNRKLKYDWENLFWSCAHCNNIKSDKYEPILDCTKENVERLVDIGVDYISSGALTHSSPILDLSLKNLHAI